MTDVTLSDRRERYATPLYAIMRQNGWDGERTERVVREMDLVLDAVTAVADSEQQEMANATVLFNAGLMRENERLRAVLRRMADETPAAETDTPAEDPARIDRLRPEFTEHASVEAIDVQLRRAQSQERRWHLRVEWLISLRAARVTQKQRGEQPAAGARQDGAQ